jgi:hypothetical protein
MANTYRMFWREVHVDEEVKLLAHSFDRSQTFLQESVVQMTLSQFEN